MRRVLITLNYNDYNTTSKFIHNCSTLNIFDKIIVVDNCSNDDSYSKLKALSNNVIEVIQTEFNGGYGYGNNYGIKYANKLYDRYNLVIANPDVEFDSTIIKLFDYLNDKVYVVGPVIKEDGSYNRGWKIPSIWDDIISNLPVLGKKFYKKRLCYGELCYNSGETVVETVSGSCFVTTNYYFDQLGYFDEDMFLYYEENVIGTKLKNLNKKTLVINDVYVSHFHSESIDKSFNVVKKLRYLKSSQLYFHENYSNSNKFQISILKVSIAVLQFMYKNLK